MYKCYNLKPVYENVKSYYGKAHVEMFDGWTALFSYDTPVLILENGGYNLQYGPFSRTTIRHIKEFLRQNGYPAMTWKEIWNGKNKFYSRQDNWMLIKGENESEVA